VRKLSTLILSFLSSLILAGICQSQDAGSPYLVRMERQTRQENVCILVQKDGHYHLERVAAGQPRVFEGTLESPTLAELEPLLTANQLVDLKQSQIETTPPGEDIDQVMITISRPKGWQTLTFSSGKSRKPFKSEIDPILRWLDRNKQRQNPITDATTTRCIPQPPVQAASAAANSKTSNPYMMRIVMERYELKGSGTAISSVSAAKGTTGQNVGGMIKTDAMDVNSFKITRTCAVVYDSGRYRFEKNIREAGIVTKSEIYRDTLDKAQLIGLRQALDNPKLAALPNNAAPGLFAREGEVISLAVPRDRGVQAVAFATFAPRPASADLREAAYTALSANFGLTNPIRKWVKQNIEGHEGGQVKDVPATACLPTAQPE
jgi:hypothetical protein